MKHKHLDAFVTLIGDGELKLEGLYEKILRERLLYRIREKTWMKIPRAFDEYIHDAIEGCDE